MGPELDLFVLPEDKRIKVPAVGAERETLQQDRRRGPSDLSVLLSGPALMDVMCLQLELWAPGHTGSRRITKTSLSWNTWVIFILTQFGLR